MREQGPAVSPAIVKQRYQPSLSLLKQHYLLFNRITLLDNTSRKIGFQTAALIEQRRVPQQASVARRTGLTRLRSTFNSASPYCAYTTGRAATPSRCGREEAGLTLRK